MTDAREKTPSNLNALSPLGFEFQVRKLPHVNFFLQRVTLPGLNIPPTKHDNPFVTIPYPGEHIEYGTLSIDFKVDEDMANYIELQNWLRGIGFPDNFDEYKNLNDENQYTGAGIRSDISLILTTNLKNPNIEVTFRDAFPISLGQIDFNTTDSDVLYLNCQAEFQYTLFDIKVLP